MSVIEKLFRKSPMQQIAQTEEPTELDLLERLADVDAQISAGSGDVALALEEKESLGRQITAARIKREQAANHAHREKVNKARGEYIAQVQAEVAELWKAMPWVQHTLLRLIQFEEHGVGGFDGKNFDEISGLRMGSAGRILQAIAQELRGTTLADQIGPPGTWSEPHIVKPREADQVVMRFRDPTDALGHPLDTKYF